MCRLRRGRRGWCGGGGGGGDLDEVAGGGEGGVGASLVVDWVVERYSGGCSVWIGWGEEGGEVQIL